jgi:TolB-like protein
VQARGVPVARGAGFAHHANALAALEAQLSWPVVIVLAPLPEGLLVAEVVETAPAQAAKATAPPEPNSPLTGRPSIAILPFRPLAMTPELAILADAIPYEIIQALSSLRWLAVIARGSSFRFRKPDPDLELVATALGARYVLSGIIEANVSRLAVTLELSDASTNEVIWGDRIVAPLDAIDDLRSRIVAHLVTALDVYIPLNEAQSAQMATIETLDAWASYHLGLQHLYRFTTTDNQRAKGLFEQAVMLDPHFARAHAGLSYTSFLEAFLQGKLGKNEREDDLEEL